jgi:prepilin-type N-terminal cleavage/methylation domain-containing protein
MRRKRDNRGFTLTELIVVISVLIILAAILIPLLSGFLNKADEAVDTANQRLLNTSTIIYRTFLVTSPDPFASPGVPDGQRMQALVDTELLPAPVSPRRRGTRFRWDTDEQSWLYEKDDGEPGPAMPAETTPVGTSTEPVSTSAEPTDTEPTPTDTQSAYPAWDSSVAYLGGSRVLYNGLVFEARNWTRGQQPGVVGNPWQEITNEWRNFNVYPGGSQVTYNGVTFTARYWSENQQPGVVGNPWQEVTDQWRIYNRYEKDAVVWHNGQRYQAKWVRDPGDDDNPAKSNAWQKAK